MFFKRSNFQKTSFENFKRSIFFKKTSFENVIIFKRPLLKKIGLPTQSPGLKPKDLIESMYHDKKTTHNKLRFILVKDIGSIEIVDDVPEVSVKAALRKNKLERLG